MKNRAPVLTLLFVLLAGGLWWLGTQSSPPSPHSVAEPVVKSSTSTKPTPVQPAEHGQPDQSDQLTEWVPSPAEVALAADVPADTKISEILSAASPDITTTAKRLAAVVLDLTSTIEQRDEAIDHLLNLSTGNENEVLLPLIRDTKLSPEHCRVILDDALNLDLDWQAEVYLTALGTRSEPELRTYIRQHLQFINGGEDLGNNPQAWVEPLLKALPSEEASLPETTATSAEINSP